MFANDHDIHRWQQKYNAATHLPVLGRAADNLAALADYADNNSDGWAYWSKPQRAAFRLVAILEQADKDQRASWSTGHDVQDITTADLTKALTPVKAFLTRQGVPYASVLL